MTANITYKGGLRTICTHIRSGNEIITDAPIDNQGKGEAFSPTDLTATSLGTCMLTVMGIKAQSWGKDIEGAEATVTKHMAADPRRISQVDLLITIQGIPFTEKEQDILRNTGLNCPVAKSLHPDIIQNVEIRFT